ncbi:Gfo/Idh/MocA family protein [Consotaella aegiceratis]|uniref:Gfo/Idh/MocA family protein n=1 Tax=Consotaella aegiceratis TaxID=3097961 RepID=UPI002F3F8E6E
MSTGKRRTALIGLGMVVDSHAASLRDLSDRVEVAYAFSPTAARREAFAERFAFPTCDSLETILADDSVDSVIVLTPPNTHLDIVRRCAEAGKHVLLEKPLEITTARATELVEICERAGVALGIVLQHRFRPAGEVLAERLREGRLGAIAGCSTGIRLWRPQRYYDEPGRGSFARDGGGVLLTQGIHTLDMMLSLTGPVAEVRGFATTSPLHRMETEDMVTAAVRYANGALGVIDATTAAYPGYPERIEMIGEKGSAVISGTSLTLAYHDGSTETVAPDAATKGTGANPMDFPYRWHRAVLADFFDALDEGRAPRVTGREALRAHRLIDALIEAGSAGGGVAVAGD